MKSYRHFLRALLTAIAIAAPVPSLAITINETLARLQNPYSYEYDLGRARVGLVLSLSTSDNWQTADIDIMVRSHLRWGQNDIFFGMSGTSAQQGIIASNFRGTGYIDYFDSTVNLLDLYMGGGQNSRMGFSLSSSNASYSVWDALRSGFSLWHGFFGNEYDNQAKIALTYPGITSYTILLGDAAAVPLPPAAGLALGALGSLAWIARKRKKSGGTPAKTAGVPAEA